MSIWPTHCHPIGVKIEDFKQKKSWTSFLLDGLIKQFGFFWAKHSKLAFGKITQRDMHDPDPLEIDDAIA